MSDFGVAAARLAGVAAQWLGWRPGDFWAATPVELESALGGGISAASTAPSMAEMAALRALHPDKDEDHGG